MTGARHLSWLYVPGDSAKRIPQAMSSNADCVIIDLEDAVLAHHKDRARAIALDAINKPAQQDRAVQIRMNATTTRWASDDLVMIRRLPQNVGVRIPKVESPETVRVVAREVPGRALHLLFESALGVERAFELAQADERVASVGLGEADLKADLGVSSDAGLQWARSRVVNASVAAGLGPPAMSVYTNVKDLDGLSRSCELGRSMGFLGRAAIHPVQLPSIRDAFTPTPAELEAAREVLSAAAHAPGNGRGAIVMPDGRFVDEAVIRQARRVVGVVSESKP